MEQKLAFSKEENQTLQK